jgi:predicted permease
MRWWQRLFRRDQLDAQLDAELRDHVERQVSEYIAAGMRRSEARRRVRLSLGGMEQIKEDCRDVRGTRWIEELIQDVRYAWRTLRKSPGFASVAVLSIALGIGANTAIFTLLDQLLLRLLPVKDPQQLVLITSRGFQYGDGWGDGNELSYPMFADLRDHNDVFSGMFCRFNFPLHISFGEQTERASGEFVSGTYFDVLGVGARLGRIFSAEEDRVPRGHPVVVLSHSYWKSRFASDPAIVGKKIIVSSHPMTVIGVAQEGFDGTNLGKMTQVFVPIMMSPLMTPITEGLDNRLMQWLNVFGRLRTGGTPEHAQVSLQPFFTSRLHMEVNEPGFARASNDDKAQFLKNQVEVRQAGYGKSDLRRNLARPLWVLMTVVGGVLLIACANVANLLLARATARQREIAVRLALGAGRRRIVQQLVVESLLLAILGGAAGLLLATWGAGVLLGLFVDPDATLTLSASPDLRILAFTFALTTLTGLMFGLMPALKSTRPELAPTLKNETGTVLGGGHGGVRKALVVSQVALSLLLLIGAGLFIRSLRNLMTVNPGFETTNLIVFGVDPALNGYQGVRSKQFAKTLLERIQSTPGVTAAAFGSNWLLTGGSWNSNMTIEGRAYSPTNRVISHNNAVSPGYFETMGIGFVAGRDFDDRDERMVDVDRKIPPAGGVIANQTFVKKYLGGGLVLGRRLGFGSDPGTPTTLEIIGVVQDAKYRSMRNDVEPQLYFPLLAGPGVRGLVMYVRTAQEPETMFQTMQRLVHQIDPNLPLHSMRTLDGQIERSLTNERLVASLSGAFSALATLLAIVGLYGVMAYTVTRRTREIGIRMALGALSGSVAWMILRDVLLLVMIGVTLALPAAWGLSRYVKSQLYGITPADPATIGIAVVLLAIAAALAGLVPAMRAARVNPVAALRYE